MAKKNYNLLIGISALVGIVLVIAFVGYLVSKPRPHVIQGEAEATEYRVSCMVPGHVTELYVREGQTVQKAINSAAGKTITVKFVLQGDENAVKTSVSSEKKALRSEKNTPSVSGLSGEFTFDNFVVGDCNRFAHASAMTVAAKPGQRQRNPFFLWGNSGLGKTHLMKAIGNSIMQQYPGKKVIYTTCEEFTNAFVACVSKNNYEPFRNKYRTVDVLLIDDIQFLIGKEGVQAEFFNTFEALISDKKQIVITCDKAPNNLKELDNRLVSRFQDGIMFDVQPPDFETRKAIFLQKMETDGIEISDDIINFVCENITTNIRQLNGAYNTLSTYLALANGSLTLEEVEKIMAPIISPNNKKYLKPEVVINAVAKYYDLPADKLSSKQRSAEIADARNVAMWICREYLEMNLDKIGSYFGGRTHSTVLHSCNNIDDNPQLKKDAEEIIKLMTT